MKEISENIAALEALRESYTIFGLIAIVLVSLVLFFSYKFIGKIAEGAAEKSLKKFQSHIDKELLKFQTKHQKQIDAVHDTYKALSNVTRRMEIIKSGKKYMRACEDAQTHLQEVILMRHEFDDVFKQNKLIFDKNLCNKIEILLPLIDEWIDTFGKGLWPENGEENNMDEEMGREEPKLRFSGVWKAFQ